MLIAIILFFGLLDARGNQMEEQIFEISTVNGALLSDPVVGLSKDQKVYLPLLDLAKILGVTIEQPQSFVYRVYKTDIDFYTVDLSSCPNPQQPDCQASLLFKGLYYLDVDYLKSKLDWPLSADLKNLSVTVAVDPRSRESLRRGSEEARPFIIERKKIAPPALRIENTLSSESDNNILNIYGSQPLLEHDSDLLLSRTEDNAQLRWTLSQERVETENPLAVRSYEIGSTQTLDSKFLAFPTQITGLKFSNIRDGENVFDTQSFYERGPPRWKVELFVNDIYLGETVVDVEGYFSFTNVPIFYGQNRILYRLTNPLGQVLEIQRTYNVSSDFEGAGKWRYQAAFGQKVNRAAYTGGAFVNYGLGPRVSAQLGLVQIARPPSLLETETEQLKAYHLEGLSFLQSNYSLSLTQIRSMTGEESAWVLAPKFNVARVLVTTEHAQFDRLRSLLINPQDSDDLQSLTTVSGLTSFDLEYPLTTQASFIQSNYGSMDSTQQAQIRAHMMFTGASLRLESNKFWPSRANPDLYVEYGRYLKDIRSKLGALIQNDRHAKTRLEIEYLMPSLTYLTFAADIPPSAEEGSYSLGLSAAWREVQLESALSQSAQQTMLSVTASTNIKATSRGVSLSQIENYRQGRIEVFAFIDDNSNDVWDPEEKPYPHLKILETQRQKDYETDAEGLAEIPALNPYERVQLQVVKESISNIFLTAAEIPHDFILTPAQQLRVEIPIKPSFDIRGSLENFHFKKLVPVEVVDNQGKIVASTISMASGKFKLTDLPGGIYFIQVSPKFLKDNALKSEPEVLAVDLNGKAGTRTAGSLKLVPAVGGAGR